MKKCMIIGKRQLLMAGLVVAVGIAVFCNWRISSEKVNNVSKTDVTGNLGDAVYVNAAENSQTVLETTKTNKYFEETRTKRAAARKEAAELYKEVLDDAKSDSEQKAEATTGINRLAKEAENENTVESLVKAKGFAECAAVISDGQITVVVNAKSLLASDTVQIQDIAASTTGFTVENIKIIQIE